VTEPNASLPADIEANFPPDTKTTSEGFIIPPLATAVRSPGAGSGKAT
jgi:hypothetical protein